MDQRLAEQLRSQLDRYNRERGLYYSRSKGWPIDKKFGDNEESGIASGAPAKERYLDDVLIQKEIAWTIVPSSKVFNSVRSGGGLNYSGSSAKVRNSATKKRKNELEYSSDSVSSNSPIRKPKRIALPTTRRANDVDKHQPVLGSSGSSLPASSVVTLSTPSQSTGSGITGTTNTASCSTSQRINKTQPVDCIGDSDQGSTKRVSQATSSNQSKFDSKSMIEFYTYDSELRASMAKQKLDEREREFADEDHRRKLENKGKQSDFTYKHQAQVDEIKAELQLEDLKEQLLIKKQRRISKEVIIVRLFVR